MSVTVDPKTPWLKVDEMLEEIVAKALERTVAPGRHTLLKVADASYPTTSETDEGVTLKLPSLFTITW